MSERRFAGLTLLPGAAVAGAASSRSRSAIVLAISFGVTDELGSAIYGWNPENYADVFDPLFVPVLLRSVGYALGDRRPVPADRLPGRVLHRPLRRPLQDLLIALVVLPFFVNYLVRTYAWVAMLSDEGLVNGLLVDLGLTTDGVRFLNTPCAVIGGLVYGYLAFMILPVYAALDRMDPSLIEAGKDLYGERAGRRSATSPGRRRSRACWPGAVLVFLPAVGDFVSAQLLGGPDTYMVGNLIQQQFFERQQLAVRRRADDAC